MPLFSEGFLKYFTSSKFCDMTLVVRNKEYKTHRIILVYNSKYFAKKLSEPQYAQQKYIRFVLDISDPNNLFPLILRYVYEGHVKVTDENCVPLLSLANFLEIEDLKKRIATFLSTSIGRKNVLVVLKRAMDFGQEEVKKQCILVLAHNFSRIAAGEPLEAPASAHGFAGVAAHASASARSHLRSGSYNGVMSRDGPIVGFASATPSAGLVPGSHSSVNLGSAGYAGLSHVSNTGSAGNGKTHTRMGSSNASISTSPPGGSSAGAHGASKWTSVAPSAVAGTVYAEQESPFRSLSVELMLTLLSHPGLAVMNENLVYKSVVDYIKAKGNELTEADRTSLYEQVRFPFLNYNQLQDVIKNNQVPHRLLAEALIVRLGSFESPNTNKANGKASLQKRTNCGMFFDYSSDFDERGVLHWIATQGHTSEWVNPIRYGVKVTASSSEKGVASDILEIKQNECWTKDVPSSWFAFDLGKNRQLLLTYYTLRHGSNSRQDCLRSWVLQCSDDGLEWETIKRHNECALNSNFATASWPVMCTNPHRYFRVLQTGHNSTNKNFFSLSGIEFYGDFYQNMT